MAHPEPQHYNTAALYNETQHIALADLGYQNVGPKPPTPQPILEAQDHESQNTTPKRPSTQPVLQAQDYEFQDIGPKSPSHQPILEAQDHGSQDNGPISASPQPISEAQDHEIHDIEPISASPQPILEAQDCKTHDIGPTPPFPQHILEAQDHESLDINPVSPSHQDHGFQDIGPIPPSRQPTLEAQNHASRIPQAGRSLMHKFRRLMWTPAIHGAEDYEIDLKAANKLHPECRRFWDNYLHLRDRPHTPFQSLSPLFIQNRRQSQDIMHIVEWSPQDGTCLSNWLESMYLALVVDSSDSLIIW